MTSNYTKHYMENKFLKKGGITGLVVLGTSLVLSAFAELREDIIGCYYLQL